MRKSKGLFDAFPHDECVKLMKISSVEAQIASTTSQNEEKNMAPTQSTVVASADYSQPNFLSSARNSADSDFQDYDEPMVSTRASVSDENLYEIVDVHGAEKPSPKGEINTLLKSGREDCTTTSVVGAFSDSPGQDNNMDVAEDKNSLHKTSGEPMTTTEPKSVSKENKYENVSGAYSTVAKQSHEYQNNIKVRTDEGDEALGGCHSTGKESADSCVADDTKREVEMGASAVDVEQTPASTYEDPWDRRQLHQDFLHQVDEKLHFSETRSLEKRDDAGASVPREPLSPPAQRHQDLFEYGWYHGRITREASERMLSDRPSGSFLVRRSSDASSPYTLSFKTGSKVLHMRVTLTVRGQFSVGFKKQGRPFDSLPELIDAYQSRPLSAEGFNPIQLNDFVPCIKTYVS